MYFYKPIMCQTAYFTGNIHTELQKEQDCKQQGIYWTFIEQLAIGTKQRDSATASWTRSNTQSWNKKAQKKKPAWKTQSSA